MIKVAARPPNANASAIANQGLTELGFRDGAPPLDAFDISIGTEMAIVPGRILPRPGVKYGKGTSEVDDRGSWNLRDVKFAKGARLDNWAVLLIKDGGPDYGDVRSITKGFVDMCRQSGMTVNQEDLFSLAVSLPPKSPNDPLRTVAVQAVGKELEKLDRQPNLVLVILADGDRNIYSGIKHLCDSYLDVGESHRSLTSQGILLKIVSYCLRPGE